MKKLVGLMSLVFLITACNEVDGVLSVQKSFDVKDKKGKVQTVPVGQFKSELKLDQDDHELEIKIEDAINGKDDVKLKVLVPGNVGPGFNGHIDLPGNLTGQSIDLGVDVVTNVSQTPNQWVSESCTYQDYQYTCWSVYDPKTKKHYQKCGYKTVYLQGRRDVEFYYVNTHVTVRSEFKSLGGAEKLADFAGQKYDSRRVIVYQSQCRRW